MLASSPDADLARFSELYRTHVGFVWSAVRRLGVADPSVEDAVQDVFAVAFRKLDIIDFDASPRAWLWGVARRVAFRHRRSHARSHRRRAIIAAAEPSPIDPTSQQDAARWVDRFLDTLDSNQREVFVMAELLGMTAPEIAATQEVPVNTVYSRLRLARRRLAQAAEHPQHARELLAGSRTQCAPTEAQRRHCWIGLAGISTTATTSIAVPIAIAAGLGSLLVLGGAAWSHTQTAALRPALSSKATLPKPLTTPAVEPSSAVVPVPHEPDEPPPLASKAPVDKPSVRSNRAASRPDLARELKLIDAAQAALDRGDAQEALVWTERHAREFATGQLRDVRLAARVRALCALDRIDAARRTRTHLQRDFPDSNVTRALSSQCP